MSLKTMAILQNEGSPTPTQIIQAFQPFNTPSSIEGMIVGNDLDSLLSACLLKYKFGWDVVGVYNLTNIWYNKDTPDFTEKLIQGKYLAVDLDIYHAAIFSIGHHIETMTRDDLIPKHERSLNPNLVRGISNREFSRKYPLGTIHFLAWILDETRNLNQTSKELVWLADSSYINGQSHRYRDNVKDWVINFFRDPYYTRHVDEIDTEEFEAFIQLLMERIRTTGAPVSRGQVGSRHLRLRGGQCQFSDPGLQAAPLDKILDLICNVSGWVKPVFPVNYTMIPGVRNTDSTSNTVSRGRMDRFLQNNKVFSYAIPNGGKINYTNGFPFI